MNYFTVICTLLFVHLLPFFIPLSKIGLNPIFAQEFSFFCTSPRLIRSHSTFTFPGVISIFLK